MPTCPQCRTRNVRQAPRQTPRENLFRFLMIQPFRCQLCTHRLLAFGARLGYKPRREYDRIPVRYTVDFGRIALPEHFVASEGTMHNISIRGCQIESREPAPPGACLRLALVAADGHLPIRVEAAVVRYAVDGLMGLEFLQVQPEYEDRLRRLIDTELMAYP